METNPNDNLELILSLLDSPDLKVRRQAYYDLRKFNDIRAIEALVGVLRDEDLTIREQAVSSLGAFENTTVVKPLLEILQNDKAPTVRYGALIAISRIKYHNDDFFYQMIYALRNDPDADVRMFAASSLGKYKDIRAVDDLIAAISENQDKEGQDYSEVRDEIALALGEIGDKRAFEPLLELLNDVDDNVRYWTAEALGQLGDTRASEPLARILTDEKLERQVRGSAARAIGELKYSSPSIIAALQGVLDDKIEYSDRHWKPFTLGEIARESLKKLGVT